MEKNKKKNFKEHLNDLFSLKPITEKKYKFRVVEYSTDKNSVFVAQRYLGLTGKNSDACYLGIDSDRAWIGIELRPSQDGYIPNWGKKTKEEAIDVINQYKSQQTLEIKSIEYID